MVIEDQFRLMVKRHEGLIRSVCVGFSRGDMELCSDLMQEAVTGMWLRFTHREARMFAAAQGVWVYWQTHHFASQALRRWKAGSMTLGDVPDVAVEESAEEALAVELAADLAGRERQLFDLLRQGYQQRGDGRTAGAEPGHDEARARQHAGVDAATGRGAGNDDGYKT